MCDEPTGSLGDRGGEKPAVMEADRARAVNAHGQRQRQSQDNWPLLQSPKRQALETSSMLAFEQEEEQD